MNFSNAEIIQMPSKTSNKESNIGIVELSLDIIEIARYLADDNDLNKQISFQLRKINYSELFNALISMSQNETIEAIDSIDRRSSFLKKNDFLEYKKIFHEINNNIDEEDQDNKAQHIFMSIALFFSATEEYAKTGEIEDELKYEANNLLDDMASMLILLLMVSLSKDEKIIAYDAMYWLGVENRDENKTRMLSYFHANGENQFS